MVERGVGDAAGSLLEGLFFAAASPVDEDVEDRFEPKDEDAT